MLSATLMNTLPSAMIGYETSPSKVAVQAGAEGKTSGAGKVISPA